MDLQNSEIGDFSGFECVVGLLKDGKGVAKHYLESLKHRLGGKVVKPEATAF